MWGARRKALHEDIVQSLMATQCFIEIFLSDLALSQPEKKDFDKRVVAPKWIPPPDGFTKTNEDSSVSKNPHRCTIVLLLPVMIGTVLGVFDIGCLDMMTGRPWGP